MFWTYFVDQILPFTQFLQHQHFNPTQTQKLHALLKKYELVFWILHGYAALAEHHIHTDQHAFGTIPHSTGIYRGSWPGAEGNAFTQHDWTHHEWLSFTTNCSTEKGQESSSLHVLQTTKFHLQDWCLCRRRYRPGRKCHVHLHPEPEQRVVAGSSGNRRWSQVSNYNTS